jgi:hypothetical protein
MRAARVTAPLLALAASAALGGCGVDSTRSLWASRWMEPHGNAVVDGAKEAAEIAGKAAITPATAALDIITDDLTLAVVWCAAEVLGGCAQIASGCGSR